MGNINARGYIRIHINLFHNTIRFGEQEKALMLGDSLLTFIYSSLKPLQSRMHYSIEDFQSVHPFFQYCDPIWKSSFVQSLSDGSKDKSFPSIEHLLYLQDKYNGLLQSIYAGSTLVDNKRIQTALTSEGWLRTQLSYSMLSLDFEDKEECWADYFVSSFEECLFIEFVESLRRKVVMRSCRNCNKLFIPRKSNSEYCQRIYTPDGRTCAEVGYSRTFAQSIKNDELLLAYTRAYKAHYARVTKPRKKSRNMTREEFREWYVEAKDKLDKARSGLIDPEEYKEWLKQ